jgi:hypothetical protein
MTRAPRGMARCRSRPLCTLVMADLRARPKLLRELVTALPFFAHRVLRLEVTDAALSDGVELESVELLLGGDVTVP